MRTKITSFSLLLIAAFFAISLNAQTPFYYQDFEGDVSGLTIVGGGNFEDSGNSLFGTVFHNGPSDQIRTNYLLLHDTIFSGLQHAGATEVTISFWVNKASEDVYFYAPLFMAYGAAPVNNENTWPMFALQTRGVAQVNCAGWSNLDPSFNSMATTNAENVTLNNESTLWLDNGQWHFYTAVFTSTTAKIYNDGVIVNNWTVDGTSDGQTIGGILSWGEGLNYICLGGNQAWTWADADPAFMFDKVRVHASALTQTEIANIMASDLVPTSDNLKSIESYNISYIPASKVINIKGLDGSETVELFNSLGQKISVENSSSISTDYLKPNVYIVKISNGNYSKTQKIVIY